MFKKILIVTSLLAFAPLSYATEPASNAARAIVKVLPASTNTPVAFDSIKSIQVDDTVTINYDPSISELINHELGTEYEQGVRVLKTKINKDSDQYFTVDYSPDPSADPSFIFLKNDKDTAVEPGQGFSGLELFIPGNGFVYISGHTNNMYNQRHILKLVGDKLVEVKQPFYYVGVDANLKQDLEIYSDATLKKSLGTLTKGSPVSVLVNQGENYLIKNNFGLVGWVKIPESLYPGETVEGIYFAGD